MKKYVLILCLTVLFSACNQKDEKESQTSEQKESVKIVFAVLPKIKDENQNRVFNAIASSEKQIKLSFKVQGNIKYFKYKIGDEVKKGDLIAKLDSKPYELKVSQVRYALSEAKASLINAKSNYERTKKLYINQNASASDIDNAKATYNATNAKVKNIKKELEYASLKLSYTKLYAPQSGFIALKYVQENENINTGSPIVLLSDKVVDEVRVQVPESYINKIKKNEPVKVIFESINKDKTYDGKISEISKFASNHTQTYKVVVKLNKSSKEIRSGMSASVFFQKIDDVEGNILFVPSNSVLNDESGYFVYILEKDSSNYLVKKLNVKVGELRTKGYEILSGLKENDYVLKAGMSEVYENMKVQISNLKDLGK